MWVFPTYKRWNVLYNISIKIDEVLKEFDKEKKIELEKQFAKLMEEANKIKEQLDEL